MNFGILIELVSGAVSVYDLLGASMEPTPPDDGNFLLEDGYDMGPVEDMEVVEVTNLDEEEEMNPAFYQKVCIRYKSGRWVCYFMRVDDADGMAQPWFPAGKWLKVRRGKPKFPGAQTRVPGKEIKVRVSQIQSVTLHEVIFA